ncbi:hypothetical protein C8N24_6620 [Solirubrobacter pauli]|uniref:Uncharacterized protein n=1 Tax=Solirubrobacter pauli TaxID=166793 RepID=A0A660KYA1_9ACTN|nr:hypothetical protein [Solirubrobacter pauli]RKQ84989.1 hypothetical protein C8N24_6620 [Solirubrobacter pauli]
MDTNQYEAAVTRLKSVNAVIEDLDPAIRADAFRVLESYVTGAPTTKGRADTASQRAGDAGGGETVSVIAASTLDDDSIIQLLEKHESTAATDNGVLVTAIFYSVFGRGPFEPKDFKTFADRHAMIWPNQYHKTVARRKQDGNLIVRKAQDGWYVTTAGEAYFRETYGVKRGNQPRPE